MFQISTPHQFSQKIITCLAGLIAIFYPKPAFSYNYEVGIKTSLNREVLNYEKDNPELVIRGGLFLNFYESFIFNFITLHDIEEDTFSYTWNLTLKNISGFMNFTAGNYNLHFGSGLIMGKKSYSDTDPFSKRITIVNNEPVTPSNGGNPAYSFYGIACEFYNNCHNKKIYLIPFFSIQKRYIFIKSCDTGSIDSSIFTLSTKIQTDNCNTEPVNIINYGGVAGIKYADMLKIQIYYFETEIKGDEGKDILWDRGKYYSGKGIDLIRNSGLFTEYADKNISIFFEPAFSSIVNEKTVTDYAVVSGIGVKNSTMNLTIKGKNSGVYFHSENSSDNRTPERIWEMHCGISPISFIETGFILYSEKDLSPGYNKDYIEGALQEKIFTSIKTDTIDINLNFKRKEHYSKDMEDTLEQINLESQIKFTETFYFKTRYSAQKKDKNVSHLYGCNMKLLFLTYFNLSLGYTGIKINGEMPFYSVITPSTEHSTITCFRKTAHGGTFNFKYKKERDSFYVRFTVIQIGSSLKGEAESALVLIF